MSLALSWWFVIEVLGLASAPLAVAVFRNLPDRGWSFAKPLGLLALGWLIWAPLSAIPALPFNTAWIVGSFAGYLLGNAALLRVGAVRLALRGLLRGSWRYILATEALFAAAFAAMLWERSFTPAVVDTEKFMDEAFLAAIWRAPHLPPPDPWLSGYTLNYYYFGHYLMALPAKVLATTPAYAFNLAVGLTFALACVAIYGVGVNIFTGVRHGATNGRTLLLAAPVGALSALLTMVAGNLAGALVWLNQARKAVVADPALHGNIWAWWTHHDLWLTYDWWSPSRVVPNTINEFPAFSFVLADLHAHVLALPYAALAIGLAFNLLRAHGRGALAFGGRLWPLGLLTTAVALGGLYAINGWDLPSYLGLALLAFVMQQWLAHGRALTRDFLLNAGTAVVSLVSLAFLVYAPFYLNYTSPAQGIGLVSANERSLPGDVWSIFALPAFLALTYLATRLGPLLQRDALPALAELWSPGSSGQIRARLSALPATTLGAAPLIALGALTYLTIRSTGWTLFWSALLVLSCLALLLHPLIRRDETAPRGAMMATLLIGCAAGLVMICELVYLRDVFGGTLFRMNSVFKFYYQTWLLAGVVSGPLLVWLSAEAARAVHGVVRGVVRATAATPAAPTRQPTLVAPGVAIASSRLGQEVPKGNNGDASPVIPAWARVASGASAIVWGAAVITLLMAAAIYPSQAIAARTANLTLPHSLDGAAYMKSDGVNGGDAPAIAWLNAHVSGDAVIVEAAQYNEYTHLGRVSAFTGLPTLLGWGGHEVQWRYTWFQRPDHAGLLNLRLDAVTQIYTNPNDATVLALLKRNQVSYLYVGMAERQTYPSANLTRFATFLPAVYHDANVTIYAVPNA